MNSLLTLDGTNGRPYEVQTLDTVRSTKGSINGKAPCRPGICTTHYVQRPDSPIPCLCEYPCPISPALPLSHAMRPYQTSVAEMGSERADMPGQLTTGWPLVV